MKIFHLPTDTLRIISTLFLSRLNHQSIKEIRLRIARILNWAKSEILFPFLRAVQPTQIQSFSTNIRPSFKTRSSFKKRPSYSLPQSAEHPIKHTHDWESRESLNWVGGEVSDSSSYCLADSNSELFHEQTTSIQPSSISRASN